MSNSAQKVVILDCTLRDGNYAVDFKFTESDIQFMTGELSRLGIQWIEVGHGLGLGAARAGKGDMPLSDLDVVQAARQCAGSAKIGMFFIPGIGSVEDLKTARDAGLDFVRIGYDAPEAERAFPFIEKARDLGLLPCLNLMKTYAITADTLAAKAAGAVRAGVEVVYCVDSAGGMLPGDVKEYVTAVREQVGCEVGFHGHDNLMLAVSNCLTALESGARYFDATLCGLGRSAGNAPTEVLVGLFDRMNITTGIDLFQLMDVIEMYMWPLVAQTHPHDMMSVAMGYSQFHSSFLPQVAAAARKHHVELRRLVTEVAHHDPVRVHEEHLETAAQRLAGTGRTRPRYSLSAFDAPELSKGRISSSLESVQALIAGMTIASAKLPGSVTVLHLEPTDDWLERFVMPEFVLSDRHMVMGRVKFGSLDVVTKVVELANPNIFLFLVSPKTGWSENVLELVSGIAGKNRTVAVHDEQIRELFLLEVLERAGQAFGWDALLVYSPTPIILSILGRIRLFKTTFVYAHELGIDSVPKGMVGFSSWEDWRNLQLEFSIILCGGDPTEHDARMLNSLLSSHGQIISATPIPNALLKEIAANRFVHIDLDLAYSGVLARQLAAGRILGVAAKEDDAAS